MLALRLKNPIRKFLESAHGDYVSIAPDAQRTRGEVNRRLAINRLCAKLSSKLPGKNNP